MNQTKDRKQIINSLLIALFIYSNSLIIFFSQVNNILVILIITICLVYVAINKTFNLLSVKSVLIILFIFLWFLISFINKHGNLNYIINYFLKFVVFGIGAFIVLSKQFNKKYVYIFIVLLSVLLIPYIINNNFFDLSKISTINYQLLMTVSYRILPGIIAGIICLTQKDMKKTIKIVSLIIVMIFGYVYIKMASRGSIVALIFFVLLYILCLKAENMNWKKIITIVTIVILLIYVLINFGPILLKIKNILARVNINIRAIDKTLFLLQNEGNVLNGRNNLYKRGIDAIKESWLVGNGIASYEDANNGTYIHNIILQVLYEGGIVCFIPLIVFFLILIKKTIKSDKDNRVFIIFLISIGLIRVLFSYYFWGEQKFWLLLAYIMQTRSFKNKEK